MTLDEKLGQLVQRAGGRSKALNSRLDDAELERVRTGGVGSYLHVAGAEPLGRLQKVAVEESRLGIPLLFAMDVVHGYRTIFPVPLAMASTWAPESEERASRVAAEEATSAGLHWTFAPMIDIARDPRWGRIVEGAGEDPYLGARMAVAQVNGYQGGNTLRPGSLMATAKHFGAYGAAIGGRDSTAGHPERTPGSLSTPFYAAAHASAGSFMVAFNDIAGSTTDTSCRGTPAALGRKGADGSDWVRSGSSTTAAANRAEAGVRLDQRGHGHGGRRLAGPQGHRRIRRIGRSTGGAAHLRQGTARLFDQPCSTDAEREARELLAPDHREAARAVARQSIVLLKNEGKLLPLDVTKLRSIAVIGALASDGLSELGSWRAQGKAEDVVTVLMGITAAAPDLKITSAPGADPRNGDLTAIPAALKIARAADLTILMIGEDFDQSGESRSRSSLELPPSQMSTWVLALNRPVVILLEAPDQNWRTSPVIVGVDAGRGSRQCLADVLFVNTRPPGGCPPRSPRHRRGPLSATPRRHGRPWSGSPGTVRYHDCPSAAVAPFGHGLSTAVATAICADAVAPGEHRHLITWRNGADSDEVVQLYVLTRWRGRPPGARTARLRHRNRRRTARTRDVQPHAGAACLLESARPVAGRSGSHRFLGWRVIGGSARQRIVRNIEDSHGDSACGGAPHASHRFRKLTRGFNEEYLCGRRGGVAGTTGLSLLGSHYIHLGSATAGPAPAALSAPRKSTAHVSIAGIRPWTPSFRSTGRSRNSPTDSAGPKAPSG
jgi:beta-glucosidase